MTLLHVVPLTALAFAAPGQADLRTTLSAPRAAPPGSLAAITVTVLDAGPGDAPAVRLSLGLGAGARLVSAAATPGACDGTRCALGSLASGGLATVTLLVRAPRAGGLEVHATATSETSDPTPGDAAAQAVLRPASAPARLPAVLVALARGSRVAAGGAPIVVSGRLVAARTVGGQAVTATLTSGAWPGLGSRVVVRTRWDGRFSARLAATVSGVLAVRFGGSAALRPASLTLGDVRVRPRIDARFGGIGGTAPTFRAIRASGRFRPHPPAGTVLRWQARSDGRWYAVGGDADLVHVRADGSLAGVLRIGRLRRTNRYRLVYAADGQAPFLAAASPAATAAGRP
jgi:hypothetical protein